MTTPLALDLRYSDWLDNFHNEGYITCMNAFMSSEKTCMNLSIEMYNLQLRLEDDEEKPFREAAKKVCGERHGYLTAAGKRAIAEWSAAQLTADVRRKSDLTRVIEFPAGLAAQFQKLLASADTRAPLEMLATILESGNQDAIEQAKLGLKLAQQFFQPGKTNHPKRRER